MKKRVQLFNNNLHILLMINAFKNRPDQNQ